MKETLKQFVSRWQKGEPHLLSDYISVGKISYGEAIQASWKEIEPLLQIHMYYFDQTNLALALIS